MNGTTGDAPNEEAPTQAASDPDSALDLHQPWSGQQRQQMVAAFERWMDAMAAGESAPDGLPPEIVAEALAVTETPPSDETDFYTLFSALTSLTGEIRLQGRAFKQLTEQLAAVETIPDRLAALEEAQERAAGELVQTSDRIAQMAATDATSSSGLPDAKDVLSLVFDLHARLERGLETFDQTVPPPQDPAPQPGLLRRLFGGVAPPSPQVDLDALREGYEMTLSRLDAALRQWGIERVGEVGEAFEPGCMQAVDVAKLADVDEGTILEVFRSGYVSHGRVLETAKVKVSKRS